MYGVEMYAAVRQFVLADGRTQKDAAEVFGVDPTTIRKMLAHPEPPPSSQVIRAKPKLGQFLPIIDAILREDATLPRRRRHTAMGVFQRLKSEHGYDGCYEIVRSHMRRSCPPAREVFIPLSHPPGHAQVDFGEAVGVIGGLRQKMHVFCLILPYSDAPFMKAYPAETTSAFLDGHVSAFAFFGKVPLSILYDNTKLAVAKITGNGIRQRTREFATLVSHYVFKDRYARIAKGSDKSKVEGLVKNGRRSFLTPVPVADSYRALNERLSAQCRARQAEKTARCRLGIGERLKVDLGSCRCLPATPLEACVKRTTRVSERSLVRFEGSDYSVPTKYAHCVVCVKAFAHEIVVIHGSDVIASHSRSYEPDGVVYDPLHYLALLEQKPGALDQAAPLENWNLPEPFSRLRRSEPG